MTEAPLPTGLMFIHGNQPELLRQLVVRCLRARPLAPLEEELFLVHSNGVAQWLKLGLAANMAATADGDGGLGVAAAVRFLLPSRFLWLAYRAVLGAEAVPETSPFDRPALLWRLFKRLPELGRQPAYQPLAHLLAHDPDLGKRHQLAMQLADVFDQYQVYRADWLAAWAAGEDVLPDHDGQPRPLPADAAWQPMLWRDLCADAGAGAHGGRAAVHNLFLAQAAAAVGRPPALPRRVIVFGLSALPQQALAVLQAIARWTQVVFCVPNPCQHYWADIVTEKDFHKRQQRRRRHQPPPVADADQQHLRTQPLLAAWGKQGRDHIALLELMDEPGRYQQWFADLGQRIDLFASHGEGCLLNQLQEDIRELRPLAETVGRWPPVDPGGDGSLRFHVAHSPQREVEVLHDQLLAAFAADPALQPADIMVMVPDIALYAPHVHAVFGLTAPGDDRHIAYALADLEPLANMPLLRALACLLELPTARLTVTQMLDLIEVPALRKRFGINPQDLPRLRQWVAKAHIHWGLGQAHRGGLGIGFDHEQNSWWFGLKRLLLGYAVGDQRLPEGWHDIEPVGDIGGLEDAALLGCLARLLSSLEALLPVLAQPAPAEVWVPRLSGLLEEFFEASDADERQLLAQLGQALGEWLAAATQAGLAEALSLAVVKRHWLSGLGQHDLNRRFFTGGVIFANLMPMRAIPFRRIYLMGMSDGDYPRPYTAAEFDLMAADYRPGDRSRRDDDRYLFLEALLSAREHLHISWVGRSLHDNSERPPSVLVSQLRDHIAAGWRQAPATANAEAGLVANLTVEHRLQPFSPDYFPADPRSTPLFTYARQWRPVVAPLPDDGQGCPSPAPSSGLAPPKLAGAVTPRQLAAFLKDPVKTFWNLRLGVDFGQDDEAAADHEPFTVDRLAQWGFEDELVKAHAEAIRHRQPPAQAVQERLGRLRRQGALPVAAAGQLWQQRLQASVAEMLARHQQALAAWPTAIDDQPIAFSHHSGGQRLLLEGTLTGLYADHGQQRCRIALNTGSLIEKNRSCRAHRLLLDWVLHLAGHACGLCFTTLVIAKDINLALPPLAHSCARPWLEAALEDYLAGLCSPLPLAIRTALVWLNHQGQVSGGPLATVGPGAAVDAAVDAAKKCYHGDRHTPGELARSPYLQRSFPSFERLWDDGRFTVHSQRLLAPLWAQLPRQGRGP